MKRDVLLRSHILDFQRAKTVQSVAPGHQMSEDSRRFGSGSKSKVFPFVLNIGVESVNNARQSSFDTNETKQNSHFGDTRIDLLLRRVLVRQIDPRGSDAPAPAVGSTFRVLQDSQESG